jgi:acyl-CoA thioester hydrolase
MTFTYHYYVTLGKFQVRVAFISEGRAQPIPKAIRALMKGDLI